MNILLTEAEYQELKARVEKVPFFALEEPTTLGECKSRFARAVLLRTGSAVAAARVLGIHRHTVMELANADY